MISSKNAIAALLELVQDVVDVGQAEAEVALMSSL